MINEEVEGYKENMGFQMNKLNTESSDLTRRKKSG